MLSVSTNLQPQYSANVVNFKKSNNTSKSSSPNFKEGYSNVYAQQKKQEDDYQKEMKRAKRKSNIGYAVSIGSGLAIIASVLFLGLKSRGGKVDGVKIKDLMAEAEKIDDPAIKREVKEELARLDHERNLYRARDLITLSNLAKKNENRTSIDIEKFKELLDKEVIGMDEAKTPIIDYLRAINFDIKRGNPNDKPIVICFDGPPGTGKSTLAKAIADAAGMYFKKVSLGGARDAAPLVGHSRTYVGATAGEMAKAQLEGNTKRVLYLFDEADKAADKAPLDALLPIFDNQGIFTDKYFNANIDLSQSMFMVTTNELERLPEALKNRLRVIKIKPYDNNVKAKIAKQKLTNALEKNKMSNDVTVNNSIYMKIAQMTEDQGGRETSNAVDSLIMKLKGMLVDGEEHINLDDKLIESLNIRDKY